MTESDVRWDVFEQQLLGFEPIASRLRPPRTQVRLVQRDVLLGRLTSSEAPLVILTAPAGAGKSISLWQWTERDARPAAWLQLDEADDDPVELLLYLAVTLGRVAAVEQAVLDLLQVREPPIRERLLPSLAASIEQAAPFLLVLDDAHLVTNEASWELIAFVLDQLPPGATLAIGTRREPLLPLARMRAAGLVEEFHVQDLAMDLEEARELLDLSGCRPAEQTLSSLVTLTEGWPTGLYLAALAGAAGDDGDLLAQSHGDQRAIASYLTSEVLDQQPAGTQAFLLETCILDRLSSPVCNAVTAGHSSQLMLERLAAENLFVIPLDGRDEWFRYHHLFGELLRTELEHRRPGVAATLHARAAAWYHEHGDEERAVRHWMAAGDVQTAAEPAFNACQELVDRGQVERANRLLELFSDGQLASEVPLTMAAAWFYGTVAGHPEKGDRWIRAVRLAPADDRPLIDGSTWHSMQLSLMAFLAPEGIGQMLRNAEEALALEPPHVGVTDTMRLLAVAHYLSGHPRRADKLFEEFTAACSDPALCAYALAFRAVIASDERRWDDAVALEQRAREQCPAMTLDVSPGMFLALPMLLARVAVLAHLKHEGLADERETAARHLAVMVPQAPWRVILGAVVLGDAALSVGDLPDAGRWTARAEQVLQRYPDAGILTGRVKRLRQALEERRLAEPLTPAERGVLELLPTSSRQRRSPPACSSRPTRPRPTCVTCTPSSA